MPSRADLTRLALRTLEDARARAAYGAIERTPAERLALAWLAHAGIAQAWQCRDFWRLLAKPPEDARSDAMHGYARRTLLTGALNAWHLRAGTYSVDIPRHRWQAEAASRIDGTALADQMLWTMCNRYQPGERRNITALFGANPLREFNAGPETVHPREPGWVVRSHGDELVVEQMTWGFPVSLRGKKGQLLKPKPVNNARFDKLGGFWRQWAAEPSYRCLIPATRFAEAVGEPGQMTETWLSVRDQPIFAWAGLWRNTDDWGACYTGVMTDACIELEHIHDRCPVILDPADWHTWLTAPLPELDRFDQPLPVERFEVEQTASPWFKR